VVPLKLDFAAAVERIRFGNDLDRAILLVRRYRGANHEIGWSERDRWRHAKNHLFWFTGAGGQGGCAHQDSDKRDVHVHTFGLTLSLRAAATRDRILHVGRCKPRTVRNRQQ
jgi:hypothetical protein